jgi:acyl dehydratase
MSTYGAVCKAAVDAALDGDPSAIRSYIARFSGVVYPGETLRVSVWRESSSLRVEARVVERDVVVLTDGLLTLAS